MPRRKTIIYTRLSTNKQDIGMEVQLSALKSYCQMKCWSEYEIVEEVESGKTISKREGIKEILEAVKAGTIERVLVYKLDRLGRKLKDILEMIELFKTHQVAFVSIVEAFDTSSPSGIAFLQITGVFAELERNMISSRTKDALAMKKAQGVKLGRPKKLTQELQEKVVRMRKGRKSWKEICETLGMNYRTVRAL